MSARYVVLPKAHGDLDDAADYLVNEAGLDVGLGFLATNSIGVSTTSNERALSAFLGKKFYDRSEAGRASLAAEPCVKRGGDLELETA